MFGEKLWLVTVLFTPDAVAIALTLKFDATRNGASYRCELVPGALPSTV
jgi:hypothetical protein